MDQEWLQRIDRHLDASEDHMRRGNEIMARNERAFLDLQSYLREATAMLGKMATAIHEQTLAFVASQRELREEIREHREETRDLREEIREHREETRGHREETREHRDETREEMRAQLAALFAILDRFNEGPRPSGA
ncbi:MAG TPA: hypothetical protein VGO80_07325 [Solirubrobacteraceae bacterium]|jgi:hypothetical protein|nr:hypothetical protein [Solirubrobacteraceae bacterium]